MVSLISFRVESEKYECITQARKGFNDAEVSDILMFYILKIFKINIYIFFQLNLLSDKTVFGYCHEIVSTYIIMST